jgi:hypothetical protein
MPRGLLFGSVSSIFGIPVEDEKRTVIGVEGALKCGAALKFEDSAEGVKVPVRSCPFACAVVGFVSVSVLSGKCFVASAAANYARGRTWAKACMGTSCVAQGGYEAFAGLDDLGVC